MHLDKVLPGILEPHESIDWFETGMYHLDVENFNDKFYLVYDGKRKINGQKVYN